MYRGVYGGGGFVILGFLTYDCSSFCLNLCGISYYI